MDKEMHWLKCCTPYRLEHDENRGYLIVRLSVKAVADVDVYAAVTARRACTSSYMVIS